MLNSRETRRGAWAPLAYPGLSVIAEIRLTRRVRVGGCERERVESRASITVLLSPIMSAEGEQSAFFAGSDDEDMVQPHEEANSTLVAEFAEEGNASYRPSPPAQSHPSLQPWPYVPKSLDVFILFANIHTYFNRRVVHQSCEQPRERGL